MSEYVWRSLDEPGFEHVRMDDSHPEWTVFDSLFFRRHDEQVYRGGYTLIVDKAWRTLEIRFMVEQEPGNMIAAHLMSNGDGHWVDADNRPLPEYDGCIDIDIQWSPLTNTLPVNRLGLEQGSEAPITVVYFGLPGIDLKPVRQSYTRVDGHTVRYTSETRDVVRDIAIDDDGFVVTYPDLFEQM